MQNQENALLLRLVCGVRLIYVSKVVGCCSLHEINDLQWKKVTLTFR